MSSLLLMDISISNQANERPQQGTIQGAPDTYLNYIYHTETGTGEELEEKLLRVSEKVTDYKHGAELCIYWSNRYRFYVATFNPDFAVVSVELAKREEKDEKDEKVEYFLCFNRYFGDSIEACNLMDRLSNRKKVEKVEKIKEEKKVDLTNFYKQTDKGEESIKQALKFATGQARSKYWDCAEMGASCFLSIVRENRKSSSVKDAARCIVIVLMNHPCLAVRRLGCEIASLTGFYISVIDKVFTDVVDILQHQRIKMLKDRQTVYEK